MRLRTAWAIPWLLAVFLSMLLTRGSLAQDENLLINGGFEDGTAAWLAVGGELTVDDALVHGGSSAGVFTADAGYPRHYARQCVPVVPFSDYEFRGHVAGRSADLASSLHLRVEWNDRADCLLGELNTYHDSAAIALEEAERWYEVWLALRSPSTARSVYLTIVVEASDTTVYLDDFAVSGPPAPTETPSPEPSPSPSASASATPTAGPDFTPTATATAQPPTPRPSATPRISPTASSWQRTPVPVNGVLRNGSFEEAGPEGLPAFWRKWGGVLARTSGVHLEGQFAAAFSSRTRVTKWAYQIVTVQGGRAYVLSAYALKDDPAVTAAYLRLSWYASRDGSGQALDIVDSTERLTDDSPEFRFLTTGAVVAPAEASSAKARLMLDPAGASPGTVYFDAVTFEETALPEPSPSPSATPLVIGDERTPASSSPAPADSSADPTSEPSAMPPPAAASAATSATAKPRPSLAGAGVAGSPAAAALGAARSPATTATAAAATATRVPVAVYRQRKSDAPVGVGAAAREESVGSGLSPQLLALAMAVPALAGAGAGVHYWRWRRARLR